MLRDRTNIQSDRRPCLCARLARVAHDPSDAARFTGGHWGRRPVARRQPSDRSNGIAPRAKGLASLPSPVLHPQHYMQAHTAAKAVHNAAWSDAPLGHSPPLPSTAPEKLTGTLPATGSSPASAESFWAPSVARLPQESISEKTPASMSVCPQATATSSPAAFWFGSSYAAERPRASPAPAASPGVATFCNLPFSDPSPSICWGSWTMEQNMKRDVKIRATAVSRMPSATTSRPLGRSPFRGSTPEAPASPRPTTVNPAFRPSGAKKPTYTPQQWLGTPHISTTLRHWWTSTQSYRLLPPRLLHPLSTADIAQSVTQAQKREPQPVIAATTQPTARQVRRSSRKPSAVAWDTVVTICRHRRKWDSDPLYRQKCGAVRVLPGLPG